MVLLLALCVGRAAGLLWLQAPAAAARPAAAAWVRPAACRLVTGAATQQRRGVARLAAVEPGSSNEYFAVIDE